MIFLIEMLLLAGSAKLVSLLRYPAAFAGLYSALVVLTTHLLLQFIPELQYTPSLWMDIPIQYILGIVTFLFVYMYYRVLMRFEDTVFLWLIMMIVGLPTVMFGPAVAIIFIEAMRLP